MTTSKKQIATDLLKQICYMSKNIRLNLCRVDLKNLKDREISKVILNIVMHVSKTQPYHGYYIFKTILYKYGISLKNRGFNRDTFVNNKNDGIKRVLRELYKISHLGDTVNPEI